MTGYWLTGQCSGASSGTVEGSTVDDGANNGEGIGRDECIAVIVWRVKQVEIQA